MLHKILVPLLVVQFVIAWPAAGQVRGLSAEERANAALATALDQLGAGDPENALRTLRPTASTSPVPALALHAQCLMGAGFSMNGEVRNTDEAVGILNAPMNAAAQAAWKQVLPECVRELQEVAGRVTATEKRAAVFYYLGLIGPDEAAHIRHLREAVKLRPDFSQAGYQLGVHLLGNGDFAEAASVLRRVAEQRPEWAEPRNNLGVVLMLSGRPAEAVQEFREALRIRADYPEAKGRLGLALYATGDYDNALVECARAVKQEPDNPLHHNCAAMVLLEKGRSSDAVAYARRANELTPGHETFQVVLAAALMANGQQAEALLTMRRAVSAEPRLRTDASRLEKADLLRGRALALARQVLQKAEGTPQASR